MKSHDKSKLRFDPNSGLLYSDGEATQLTPTTLALLQYFLKNPGRLISKQELLEQLWKDVYVEDSAVKGYVRKLRKILNDNPSKPEYIETARGFGYRYIGNIKVGQAVQLPGNSNLTIAVLPFKNLSTTNVQDYFCEGISEDILTELARFPVISVIARHSSFEFKAKEINVSEVGQKLGAQFIVEGSVRRSNNRVRVNAQLSDAKDNSTLWAERYDRELTDIFAVQDEVTRAIVATIAAQLGKTIAESASRKSTTDIQSYEYFMQGNRHYYRFNPEDNNRAAKFYEKSIKRDPQFARAHAGLANTFITDHFLVWRCRENALQNCLDSVRTALALDCSDGLARIIHTWALIADTRWEEAELEVDRLLTQVTGDADVMVETGHCLYIIGRHETGLALIEEAVRLNPLFPDSYRRWLGIGYYRARRYRDSADTLRSVQLDGWGFGWLTAAFARLGQQEEATEALNKFIALRKKELNSTGNEAGSIIDLLGNYRDNFRHESEWQHFIEGLVLAGLVV